MAHELVLRFDEATCRAAVARYWQGQFGWRTIIELSIGAVILIVAATYSKGWLTGALGAVVFMYAALSLYAYVYQRKRILDLYRMMNDPEVRWTLNENSLATKSSVGYSEMPWSSITELWKFSDLWLLFLARNAFITLPLNGVSDDAKAFLESKIASPQGKVRYF